MKDDASKTPLPWFKLYVTHFLTTEALRLMSNAALGLYLRLICYCWREGSVPADEAALARLTTTDPREMQKHWPEVSKQFTNCTQVPARLRLQWLDDQREQSLAYRERQVRAGQSRWIKDQRATAQPPLQLKGSGGLASAQRWPSDKDTDKKRDKEKYDVDPETQNAFAGRLRLIGFAQSQIAVALQRSPNLVEAWLDFIAEPPDGISNPIAFASIGIRENRLPPGIKLHLSPLTNEQLEYYRDQHRDRILKGIRDINPALKPGDTKYGEAEARVIRRIANEEPLHNDSIFRAVR